MQEKNNLKIPARYIKGVGPKKSELLSRLGLNTVEDILYYLPRRYEDRSSIVPIKELKAGESHTIQGEITSCGLRRSRANVPIFQAVIGDGTGNVNAVWFNRPHLKDSLKKGDRLILYGRAELYDRLQLMQPEYECLVGDDADSVNIGRIVPVYPLTEDLTQRYMRSIVYNAIEEYSKALPERLPTYMIAREKLVDSRFAVRNIHFPSNFRMLEKAYRRVVFEEFLVLQLALAMRRAGRDTVTTGYSIKGGSLSTSLIEALPFELTGAQKKAIAEIERDMALSKPMNRLLEGDVGSGKTVVAAYSLVLAVQNGYQGVLMAPTEVLARQHFIALSELLMPLGVNVALLLGGMEQDTKRDVSEAVNDGSVDILVGTHAVIQEGVRFKMLGAAVIDEQHKFGVRQRATLREKGYNPHVLVMTATPIPRTLALTVYGDLDISAIKELPKGRGPIVTYWVEESGREEIYAFVREELKKGRQAYVVCPLIESHRRGGAVEDGMSPRRCTKSATEAYEILRTGAFKDYRVALLHGRMSLKEKESVMKEFKNGSLDVLVSTVVIEVGIDIPNATVMLVENAERFGLSQLHQLRGRIGRSSHESYCILLSDPGTDAAAQRLKTIEGTLDGFEIAEADMDIRGPGEMFGTRQHGLPEIRFGNIAKDFDIMEAARKEAFGLIAKDPSLKEEHHAALRATLAERFKGKLELARVG